MGQANQSMPLFFYIIAFTKFCGKIALLASNTAIFDHHTLLMFHFIIGHLNVLKYGLRFFYLLSLCFVFVVLFVLFVGFFSDHFLNFFPLFCLFISKKDQGNFLMQRKMNITVVTIGNGASFQDQSQRDVK